MALLSLVFQVHGALSNHTSLPVVSDLRWPEWHHVARCLLWSCSAIADGWLVRIVAAMVLCLPLQQLRCSACLPLPAAHTHPAAPRRPPLFLPTGDLLPSLHSASSASAAVAQVSAASVMPTLMPKVAGLASPPPAASWLPLHASDAYPAPPRPPLFLPAGDLLPILNSASSASAAVAQVRAASVMLSCQKRGRCCPIFGGPPR